MRRILLTSLAVAVIIPAILMPRVQASDAGEIERWLTAERSAHGLNGMSACPDLESYAAQRAAEQAAELRIWHAVDLTSAVSGWVVLGEIVGRGTSIGAVTHAWSQSPTHVDQYLDPRYTEVGVGTAMGADGWVYAAVIFRLPTESCAGSRSLGGPVPPAPSAPASAPPAPAPAPVADPAPASPPAASAQPAQGGAEPDPLTSASAASAGDASLDDLSAKLVASLEGTRTLDAPSSGD